MARPLRILVADDDPEMLDVLVAELEAAGAEVARAEDGAALIQRLANEGPFDLVITDLAMPWMSGLQVAHAARTAQLATPLNVITARREPEIEQQVAALGERALLLRKPFDREQLHAAVAALVGRRSA